VAAPGHSSTPDPAILLHGQPPQAMEPAVAYVQKIKQRCDPETYKQFLDILSRYHHKPDTIDEVCSIHFLHYLHSHISPLFFGAQEEVSKQIGRLFKDAPDLRADFRIFMPEKSQSLLDDAASSEEKERGRHHRVGTPSGLDPKGKRKLDAVASSMSSSLPQKRKRKVGEKDKDREREKDRDKELLREKERERELAASTSKTSSGKVSFIPFHLASVDLFLDKTIEARGVQSYPQYRFHFSSTHQPNCSLTAANRLDIYVTAWCTYSLCRYRRHSLL